MIIYYLFVFGINKIYLTRRKETTIMLSVLKKGHNLKCGGNAGKKKNTTNDRILQ